MYKILIVEDDADIGNYLETLLTGAGYEAVRAYSGTEALLLTERGTFDLILLDLMLPGVNGEEIVDRIKDTPIIVVSAKATVEDRVRNLLHGAADFVSKPFSGEELLARITVQLRAPAAGGLVYGHIRVDPKRRVAYADEKPLKLTRTEYEILRLLISSPKRIFSRAQIADSLSEGDREIWETSLSVHIHNLRKKIYSQCGETYIEAIWGIGYRLETESGKS